MKAMVTSGCRVAAVVLLSLIVFGAAPASAQDNPWEGTVKITDVRSLGGANALRSDPLGSVEDLRSFFIGERAALTRALELADWSGKPDDLFNAIKTGPVEEISFPVGARLHWMALRRGGRTLDVLQDMRWAGKEPFDGFLVRFVSADYRWAFVVPKACGNLSLLSRMGTDELKVVLTSGVLELFDPEGRPITIRPGETGYVSATYSDRYAGRDVGEVDVPTTLAVSEGTVQFSEYNRPVAILVTEGNEVSATMSSKGQVELAVPSSNVSDLPVRVGDAYGYLKGGVDMAVVWPAPDCRLTVRSVNGCAPGEVEIDARATSVEKGEIASLDVTAVLPDGSKQALGAPKVAGDYIWRQSFEQVGQYEFLASARSVRGLASVKCSAQLELDSCLPPPPICELNLAVGDLEAYETFTVDAASSTSDEGSIDTIEVEVLTAAGRTYKSMILEAPWTGEVEVNDPGRYVIKATAVDSHGQRSDPYRGVITVEPRRSYSLWAVAGFGSNLGQNGGPAEDGFIGGVKASFEQQFAQAVEVSLGIGALYSEANSGETLYGDITVDWLPGWGFFGAGLGMWDLTNGDNRDLDLIVHGGLDLPFSVGGEPVTAFAEGRFAVGEFNNISDVYRFLAGVRFRPW